MGNIIDPNDLVKRFGIDATRYLLLSQFPFGRDGDVKESKFVEKYNADLANGLGNLVARVLTLASKSSVSGDGDQETKKKVKEIQESYKKAMEEIKLYEALDEIWKLISWCDSCVEKEKPWKLTEGKKLEQVLSNLLYCISEIAELIETFLPETNNFSPKDNNSLLFCSLVVSDIQ